MRILQDTPVDASPTLSEKKELEAIASSSFV